LTAPWKVVRSGLEDASDRGKVLYVDIDFEDGEKFRRFAVLHGDDGQV
jgi:hypothetical protein